MWYAKIVIFYKNNQICTSIELCINQWRSYTRPYPGICPGITSLCPGIRKWGSHWHSRKYCISRHKLLPYCRHTPNQYYRCCALEWVQHWLGIFPYKNYFRYVSSRALLLLGLFTELIAPLFHRGGCGNQGWWRPIIQFMYLRCCGS